MNTYKIYEYLYQYSYMNTCNYTILIDSVGTKIIYSYKYNDS